MMRVPALCAAAALCGGIHFYGGQAPVAVAATPAASAMVYRLVANGEQACTVVRGAPLDGGLSELRPSPGCEKLMPGLSRARFWREREDGAVAFSADGTDEIAAFASADGEGYESFRPMAPVLSLVAR